MGRKCKSYRIGEENLNNQGCLMKIIEYNAYRDVTIEFQDIYKTKIKTQYIHFINGNIINPYFPSVYNIGIVGNKYNSHIGQTPIKEYDVWQSMLQRCFDEKYKNEKPTYKDVTCCNEWLLYENFYEWIHKQENFEKWLNGDKWAIDKDILVKGNKVYSPETCCLVPQNVNQIFLKCNAKRGSLPIGVSKNGEKFIASCSKQIYLGIYNTPEEAFFAYKTFKENYIKQIAQEEYDKGNITKQCYDAMMNYEVEIDDYEELKRKRKI